MLTGSRPINLPFSRTVTATPVQHLVRRWLRDNLRGRPPLVELQPDQCRRINNERTGETYDERGFIANVFEPVAQEDQFVIGEQKPIMQVIRSVLAKFGSSVLSLPFREGSWKCVRFSAVGVLRQEHYRRAVGEQIKAQQAAGAVVRITNTELTIEVLEQLGEFEVRGPWFSGFDEEDERGRGGWRRGRRRQSAITAAHDAEAVRIPADARAKATIAWLSECRIIR